MQFKLMVHDYLKKLFNSDGDHSLYINLYDTIIRETETSLIEFILRITKGNQNAASEMLGINRNTLRKKIIAYKIDIDQYK